MCSLQFLSSFSAASLCCAPAEVVSYSFQRLPEVVERERKRSEGAKARDVKEIVIVFTFFIVSPSHFSVLIFPVPSLATSALPSTDPSSDGEFSGVFSPAHG